MLIHQPKILFLDEPIDPIAEAIGAPQDIRADFGDENPSMNEIFISIVERSPDEGK